jgi:hypothetical protein
MTKQSQEDMLEKLMKKVVVPQSIETKAMQSAMPEAVKHENPKIKVNDRLFEKYQLYILSYPVYNGTGVVISTSPRLDGEIFRRKYDANGKRIQ